MDLWSMQGKINLWSFYTYMAMMSMPNASFPPLILPIPYPAQTGKHFKMARPFGLRPVWYALCPYWGGWLL